MSTWDIGAYDIGFMPGAWRCDGFMHPLWEAEHKLYLLIFKDDWKPWFKTEAEKKEEEEAEKARKAAEGASKIGISWAVAVVTMACIYFI